MNPIAADRTVECVIHARLRSGVWSVTKNDRFYGDYLSKADAVSAACAAARAVEALGGTARVLAGADGVVVAHQAPPP